MQRCCANGYTQHADGRNGIHSSSDKQDFEEIRRNWGHIKSPPRGQQLNLETENVKECDYWASSTANRQGQALKENKWHTTNSTKKRIKFINLESGKAPGDRTATIDSMSQGNLTCQEDHWNSHEYSATTMRKSSLYATGRGCCDAEHKEQKQWCWKMAPLPWVPAAS